MVKTHTLAGDEQHQARYVHNVCLSSSACILNRRAITGNSRVYTSAGRWVLVYKR